MASDSAIGSDKLAYTVEEAGRAIGVSRSTVFDMIRVGELTAKKLRGRTVIARVELQRVLTEAPNARPDWANAADVQRNA
jgi:excisionase family DNA binding protein